jgi:hypothetical protein
MKSARTFTVSCVSLLLLLGTALAQGASPARKSGRNPAIGAWEGTAKNSEGEELQVTIKLKAEGDKIVGVVETPEGNYTVTGGSFAEGKLALDIENPQGTGKVTAAIKQNAMTGEWTFGADKGTFECARAAAGKTAPAKAPPAPKPQN